MIWVDREVKKIKEKKNKAEWVDDMKTPSGRIHVGSLRGVIVHDLLYKVLLENGIDAKFSYVFNDMDSMDSIPSYLDQKKYEKYAGAPLNQIPSPEPGFDSFAKFYATEFMATFEKLNCHPQIIWSSDLYESGKMNNVIKEILDNVGKVRTAYLKVAKAKKGDDWYPFQPICEKCGKVGTTYVYKWDGKEVYYRCKPDLVKWAKGCGFEGKISPFDGKGKLAWRLDWPAHWKVIGITVECSGKDHMSSGGSYDMAKTICETVLKYPTPYAFGYEWFTIGGKKMSSSKGIGSSAKEVTSILPPDVFRFFMVRNSVNTHIDFDPFGGTIPKIFDEYDRCMNAYFDKLENKIPDGKPGEVILEYARIMELSEVRPLPEKRVLLPRFRTIVNLIESKTDLLSFFEKQKGTKLDSVEKEMLEEREIFAQVYLKNYANTTASVVSGRTGQDKITTLTKNQKDFLKTLADNLTKDKPRSREEIQTIIFSTIKSSSLKPKEAFLAFYQTLTGKSFGPKAADLILEAGIEKIVAQLMDTKSQITQSKSSNQPSYNFPDLTDKNIFSIDKTLAQKYPSINIGIAIIKGVKIEKSNKQLDKETEEFLKSQSDLTTEILGTYPEVKSYRRLYKETGIDWHSRRPSPEALLRRVALKKRLYKINTCVDAYNLVVMKHRISSGAFDLDKIAFPTVLRFPKADEEILLLGDDQPTKYKPTEVAYFDQNGGYNIDFNYRDSQQTAVTEQTKNLLINIDGVYDITREVVERTLRETIEVVIKYCGGKLEFASVASAEKVV